MTDYGHEVQFGVSVTPTSAAPDRVVALAVLAEQSGLDVVTFQDHPYQPALLDVWTLLSFVAARTTTVTLAPNVVNLPLRPPAVLARGAASLDLLSGGRVELGVGAGAFWDPIVAMGGPRLSPGEAVQALAEAIEVLRAVWDTGQRGGVRVEGRFHRVVGARRGPAPAHPIGLWVGAYGPRMLDLTARLADGWLPSTPYLKPGDLGRGNARIDEAARDAGRAPAEIRRLLNVAGRFAPTSGGELDGPPRQWADHLTELAVDHGVSTFLLLADDPDDLRRFAAEVAPAVREQVAAARAGEARAESPTHVTLVPGSADGPPESFPVRPTPDDGTRRSAVRLWDESARPTVTAAEDGADLRHLGASRELVAVHDHLREELSRIDELVEQVLGGLLDAGAARSAVNELTMRQNRWTLGTYCESYCRIVTMHHTIEDTAVFPHLRAGDPQLGPVIDRLEEEHHVIHDVLERLDRALVAFVSRPGGETALRSAVDLLSDTLLSHLAYEERQLLEPLARLGMFGPGAGG